MVAIYRTRKAQLRRQAVRRAVAQRRRLRAARRAAHKAALEYSAVVDRPIGTITLDHLVSLDARAIVSCDKLPGARIEKIAGSSQSCPVIVIDRDLSDAGTTTSLICNAPPSTPVLSESDSLLCNPCMSSTSTLFPNPCSVHSSSSTSFIGPMSFIGPIKPEDDVTSYGLRTLFAEKSIVDASDTSTYGLRTLFGDKSIDAISAAETYGLRSLFDENNHKMAAISTSPSTYGLRTLFGFGKSSMEDVTSSPSTFGLRTLFAEDSASMTSTLFPDPRSVNCSEDRIKFVPTSLFPIEETSETTLGLRTLFNEGTLTEETSTHAVLTIGYDASDEDDDDDETYSGPLPSVPYAPPPFWNDSRKPSLKITYISARDSAPRLIPRPYQIRQGEQLAVVPVPTIKCPFLNGLAKMSVGTQTVPTLPSYLAPVPYRGFTSGRVTFNAQLTKEQIKMEKIVRVRQLLDEVLTTIEEIKKL